MCNDTGPERNQPVKCGTDDGNDNRTDRFKSICIKACVMVWKGNQAAGYQSTAILFALLALPMFWAVAYLSKEKITVKKEEQGEIKEGLKLILRNKNLLCTMLYAFLICSECWDVFLLRFIFTCTVYRILHTLLFS